MNNTNNKQNKQFEYPYRDIEHYIKEYIGNFNAINYDELEDIQTLFVSNSSS
jgi:hypothetical protein